MQADIPRIVIAGTHSGCGKTTIASGLMAALVARGLDVQPFKTGPDFIDPSHHTLICGRASRNLDPCMMGESGVLRTFADATTGADIAVIEGAMGMFDGTGGTDTASAAHIARILKAPVILVVDAHAVSRSIHAVIRGFKDFDPRVTVAGIIYNRIGSDRHRTMIAREEIVPALGWVPRHQECEVKSRHLGLVMASESPAMKAFGRVIQESCDLERILAVAAAAPPLAVPGSSAHKPHPSHRHAVIGVAHDDAFCFYYQDNLDRLSRAGADSGISRLSWTRSRRWMRSTSGEDTPSSTQQRSNARGSGSTSATGSRRACRCTGSAAGLCTCADPLKQTGNTRWPECSRPGRR